MRTIWLAKSPGGRGVGGCQNGPQLIDESVAWRVSGSFFTLHLPIPFLTFKMFFFLIWWGRTHNIFLLNKRVSSLIWCSFFWTSQWPFFTPLTLFTGAPRAQVTSHHARLSCFHAPFLSLGHWAKHGIQKNGQPACGKSQGRQIISLEAWWLQLN